ncbi:MAG: FecR/PupR family sigma factor regulator [Nitrospira sp.]
MQWTDESDDKVPSANGAQLREEAVAWVIRLHGDGMSPEDRRAFDAWHAQSLEHAHMFRMVFTVWNSAELRAAADAAAKPQSSPFNIKIVSRR